MFEDILQLVKSHLGNNPEINAAIPAEKQDEVHREIATHLDNGLQTAPAAASEGGFGGILSTITSGLSSGGAVSSAIEGGLISSLASKFGLPPSATGAIAGALPGLIQKFMQSRAQTTN